MNHDIDYYNPYPSFQPGQAEAINQMLSALDDGRKVVELNAPTASGKSLDLYVLGLVLSKELDMDKTIYSTPLVSLVDQLGYTKEFSNMPILKGKRNYLCNLVPSIMADDCPFKNFGDALVYCKQERDDEEGKPCKDCLYQKDRARFKASKFGATTFARYLVDPACHSNCRALLIDESAGLEKTLVDWSTLKLPATIDKHHLRSSVVAYNQELMEQIKALEKKLAGNCMKNSGDLQNASELQKNLNRLNRESAKCHKIIHHIDSEHKYFLDSEMRFRLLEGKSEFSEMIEHLDFVVLASGTPTTGLYCDDFQQINIQHPIPIASRLIHYIPIGSMAYKERQATAPKMAAMIEKLHAKSHKKTMVHCGAYNIARMLYDNMTREGRKIAILQDQKDREASKTRFLSCSEGIFLSVAYSEGLDLKGEEYPLNIIAKVPFENIGDEFIKARNANDNYKRYNLFAAVEVMQAAGRCTRTVSDFSDTYILDESWKQFFGRSRKLFPPWFTAALKSHNSVLEDFA